MASSNIVSFFSGAGGLDIGFKQAGFNTIWSNEYDKNIWATHEKNFPSVTLCRKSIVDVDALEVPDCDGMIGGPPCQSFSEAGMHRGVEDARGKLFWEYIRILKAKQPKFFVAENVSGLMHKKHEVALKGILDSFKDAGYDVHVKLYNASEYGVPQDRERLIMVGLRTDLGLAFVPPDPVAPLNRKNLKDAIGDLPPALPVANGRHLTGLAILNHEYMTGGFSSMFMSRNRVRSWDDPSFTVLAMARQTPLHPQAPKMVKTGVDKFEFVQGQEHLYRRLSVRECARIQGFPDDYEFVYNKVEDGYKMVGNAVPVELARQVALKLKELF